MGIREDLQKQEDDIIEALGRLDDLIIQAKNQDDRFLAVAYEAGQAELVRRLATVHSNMAVLRRADEE